MGRPGGGWRGECPALYRHGQDNPGRLPGARRHLRLTGGARKGDEGAWPDNPGRSLIALLPPDRRRRRGVGTAEKRQGRRAGPRWGRAVADRRPDRWSACHSGRLGRHGMGEPASCARSGTKWCSIRHSAGSVGASAVPRRPSPRPAPAGGYGRRTGAARRRPPEASCPAPPRPGQPRTLPFLIASPPPKRPGLTRRWLGRAGRFPAGRLRAGARDGPGPATPPRRSAPSAGG